MWKFLCPFFVFPGVPFSKLCKNCSVVSCYRRNVPNEDNEYFDKNNGVGTDEKNRFYSGGFRSRGTSKIEFFVTLVNG